MVALSGMPRIDDVPPALLGRSASRYEVLARLASGGMGTVYVGRAIGVGGFERIVAIKCCHPHLRHDEEFAKMFLAEARLAARIRHAKVVATLDVGDEGALYLVMEYVEGERLSELMQAADRAGERLPPAIALRVVVDALEGLHAAHELRDADDAALEVIHRDVSPQNVMVGTDGIARLLDFGIARAAASATITREARVRGKLAYLAPEALAAGEATRQTDLFAAGVVLWEALTGRRLFAAASDALTTAAVLHAPIAPPSSFVAGVAPALDRIVLRALARDPAERYASAADFAEAIERGPISLASPRETAAYLRRLLGAPLAARGAALRELQRRPGGSDTEIGRVQAPGVQLSTLAPALHANIPTEPTGLALDSPTPQAAPSPAPSPRSGRRAVGAVAGASLAVLLLAIAGGWAMRSREPVAQPPHAAVSVAPPAPTERTPLPAPPPSTPTAPPETTGGETAALRAATATPPTATPGPSTERRARSVRRRSGAASTRHRPAVLRGEWRPGGI